MINRYVLVNLDNTEQSYEYETLDEAIEQADSQQAVIERQYEFTDSELAWTPDGSSVWPPEPMMVLYECEICSGLHPWDWNGDCRDNANRYPDVEEYARLHGVSADDIEVRSMSDRVNADAGEESE